MISLTAVAAYGGEARQRGRYSEQELLGKLDDTSSQHEQLATLAHRHADDRAVRWLADVVVARQREEQQAISDYAAQANLSLADARRAWEKLLEQPRAGSGKTLSSMRRAKVKELLRLDGAAFDGAYLTEVIDCARRMESFLAEQRPPGADARLLALVDRSARMYRELRREAERIQARQPTNLSSRTPSKS